MAEGDLWLNCTNLELSAEDLLRLVCVTSDCDTSWFDCDNDDRSIEDLLRLLVREDENGNPALAVCGCDGGGGGGDEIEQGVDPVVGGTKYTGTFGAAFADTSYSLLINIYDANGASVGFVLDSKAAANFEVTPSDDGTINWAAIKT